MTWRDDHLVLNDAASQADRVGGAPDPARAQVDGRSLAELLAFAVDYGTLIQFYDLEDQSVGDWSSFFLGDESVRLALCAGLDLADIEVQFDHLLEALQAADGYEARLERVQVAITLLLRLARILDRGQHDARNLEDVLARLALAERGDLLAQPTRQLAMHLGGQTPESALRRDLETYSGDWFKSFVDYLGQVIAALMTALEQGRDEAIRALELSYESRDHAPQAGLYDAFAKLFGHAQTSANRFSARFAEFYRAQVLKQAQRIGSPDQLSLTFTPAKGVASLGLPRGAKFTAGADSEGATIAYALDNTLEVCAAELASLQMVTVTRQPASASTSAPAPEPPGLPAQVFTSVAALAATPPRIATPFPLFGATVAGHDGVLATSLASLGFAIASPTLLLAGGSRTVRLGLTFTEESHAAALGAVGAAGVPADGDGQCDSLIDLLEAAFALRYSTNGGWISIPGYDVSPPAAGGEQTYTLCFTLDPNAAPVAPLSSLPANAAATPPAADAAIPDADTPTLAADLKQSLADINPNPGAGIWLYPYAVLSKLVLSAVSLEADVKGLSDLLVSNTGAPVDVTRPFPTFGSPPTRESTLDITSPELFAKTLSSFTLNLDWFGLPVDQQGFYNYYFAYVINANGDQGPPGALFDNTTFKGTLTVANPGGWTLGDNSQQLFRTVPPPPDTAVVPPNPEPRGTLARAVSMAAPVAANDPPPYYDPAASAVRLSLTDPDYAFGNSLYAANVMEASVQLTAAASACAQQCGGHSAAADALAHLAPVIAVNDSAADGHLAASLKAAVGQAVAGLDGDALNSLMSAIDAIQDSDTRASLKASLSAALATSKGGATSLLQRLSTLGGSPPDYASVHASLKAWRTANAAALDAAAPASDAKARALLDAGDGLGAMLAQVAPLAPAVARPVAALWLKQIAGKLTAAIGTGDDCVQKCLDRAGLLGLPNTPWLPMASGLSVDYVAATAIPAEGDARFYWLEPFDQVSQPVWSENGRSTPVSLLAPIADDGNLYIGLSDPVSSLSLLFQMAPPAGGWPSDTPAVDWSARSATGAWTPVVPLRDTTHNLRNPGIVSLTLPDETVWLRVGAPSDEAGFPDLAGLVPNAATATWVGPGGAEALGSPRAAGSVTKALDAIPTLGSVDQPEPSSRGRPQLEGRAFGMWLAERLRHKDRGIDGWDYARLALAEFPSVQQVAVAPASAGTSGLEPAPGYVWVVAVPGPQTAGVADPTEPTNDAALLEAIQAYLAVRISPFIKLSVTNPPYRRLMVSTDVIFTDVDTVEANKARLNNDLIAFLSPWAPKAQRPPDYYTRRQVMHFVRHRPYVRGVRTLTLIPEFGSAPGWHYLTSALAHQITGAAESATERRLATAGAPPVDASGS